jgi:hypothetical protein
MTRFTPPLVMVRQNITFSLIAARDRIECPGEFTSRDLMYRFWFELNDSVLMLTLWSSWHLRYMRCCDIISTLRALLVPQCLRLPLLGEIMQASGVRQMYSTFHVTHTVQPLCSGTPSEDCESAYQLTLLVYHDGSHLTFKYRPDRVQPTTHAQSATKCSSMSGVSTNYWSHATALL